MPLKGLFKNKRTVIWIPAGAALLLRLAEYLFDVFFGDGDGSISHPVAGAVLKYMYFGGISISVLLWIYFSFKGKPGKEIAFRMIFFCILISFTWLMAEVVVYLLLCFSVNIVPGSPRQVLSYTAVSEPKVVFNKPTGYKWLPGKARIIRIMNNEVVYDYDFSINNAGYHSARDYNFKKDSGTYRIMVMGDSFTNEIYEEPWIDKIQKKTDSLGKKIEWYAFTSDGGGLYNWHEILFNEIVPSYDFDAVVICSFIDNLNRGYSIFDSRDGKQFRFARFNKIPASEEDYKTNFLPTMGPTMYVLNEKGIDSLKELVTSKKPALIRPAMYMTNHLCNKYFKKEEQTGSYSVPFEYSLKDITGLEPKQVVEKMRKRYPKGHIEMLENILTYCRDHNKKLILSSIPQREALTAYLQSGENNLYREEIKAAASAYNVSYFDGYTAFDGMKSADVPSCYLKYDGHWAEKGSSCYAGKLAKFVIDNLN